MHAADLAGLEKTIEAAFDNRDSINTSTRGEVRDAVAEALNLLDNGKARVATRGEDGTWTVHQWLKKAVLLSFRLNPMEIVKGGRATRAGGTRFRPSSTAGRLWNSRSPVSAPCRTASSAARPISPPARS